MTTTASEIQTPEEELRSRGYRSRAGFATSPGSDNTADVDRGPLRAMIEAYLMSIGYQKYRTTEESHPGRGGEEYWAHHLLGGGRTFEQVVRWQIEREGLQAHTAPTAWPEGIAIPGRSS
jgi:hypothetical protein